jgi:hypothetical protein
VAAAGAGANASNPTTSATDGTTLTQELTAKALEADRVDS